MSDLFWEVISLTMRQIMTDFSGHDLGSRFYLAGGTALALQLGHRQSFDLDYFSPGEDIPAIRESLAQALKAFEPVLADAAWGNLVFLAHGVRVGFYGYGCPMVGTMVEAEGARLAGIEDIGLMKLDALLGRASRKDFHDLYVICQRLSLRQMLDSAPKKYPHIRDFEAQVVRRLAYFERAEQEEPVPLLQEVPWEMVKQYFRDQAITLGRGWIE